MKFSQLLFTDIFFLSIVVILLFGCVSANFMPLPELPIPIYIREDGTIERNSENIQRIENMYKFTNNIRETIEIQKDNIILDGNGFTLSKPPEVNTVGLMTPIGWFPSIQILNRDNITIKNITFHRCHTSISIKNSSNIVIIQNTISNGNEGIYIISSTNCSIIGNEIIDHSSSGLKISESSYFQIAYNIISRNHFHGAWIALSYSNITRNNITNNIGSNVGIGLYLYGPNSNNQIFENNFIDNDIGLVYQGSSINNKVYNNYWSNNREQMGKTAADGNDSDQSPLTNPISTTIDPTLSSLQTLNVAEYSSQIVIPLTLLVFLASLMLYKRRLQKRININ